MVGSVSAVPSSALISLLVVALIVGVLVGSTGVGGLPLPPALVYLGGLPIHAAVATSVWAFLFTGLAGTAAYAWRRSISWTTAAWLAAGSAPAAVLGAITSASFSATALASTLALVVASGGLVAVVRRSDASSSRTSLHPAAFLALGAGVGYFAALTGTGGPVLLVPVLLVAHLTLVAAVGAGQVIQLPIAAAASGGYLLYGDLDLMLGTMLGGVAVGGVLLGAQLAHELPVDLLGRLVGLVLILAGTAMLAGTLIG